MEKWISIRHIRTVLVVTLLCSTGNTYTI